MFCLKERAWDDGYIVREDKLIDFLRSNPLKTGVRVKGRRRGSPVSISTLLSYITAVTDLYHVCSPASSLTLMP